MVGRNGAKRAWRQGGYASAILLGLGICAVGLSDRASGVVKTSAPSRSVPADSPIRTDDTQLIPTPIRPGCCMPPDPQTLEAVCSGGMTSTDCQAAGGRPVRSCLRCGLSLLPETPEETSSLSQE